MNHKYIFFLTVLISSLFSLHFSFGNSNKLLFENFSAQHFSKNWEIRKFKGENDCKVVKEGENFVLRLRSKKTSFLAYKKQDIKLSDFNRLNWSWKVSKHPNGGDIRSKNKNDQAAQVYVRFPIVESRVKNKFFGAIWKKVMSNDLNMYILGYVWDNKAPVGLSGKNSGWPPLRYMVLESGTKNLNKWVDESRNIYNDYKKLFGHTPPSFIEGIGVMINTNNTGSFAETFYDNFVFEKE